MDRMKPVLSRELRKMSLAEADEVDREDRTLSTPQERFDSMLGSYGKVQVESGSFLLERPLSHRSQRLSTRARLFRL